MGYAKLEQDARVIMRDALGQTVARYWSSIFSSFVVFVTFTLS